jgi:signal transduction histidine kinase
LQAQLRAQLLELQESRARIVRADDEERRRLERDLHDGAQQRLLSVRLGVQLVGSAIDGNERAASLVDEAAAEVQQALAELRELARGIHAAVLTDQGLDAAVRTVAARAPAPVTVTSDGERLPAHVETAAYFVVAEALANIAKYANATRVRPRHPRPRHARARERQRDHRRARRRRRRRPGQQRVRAHRLVDRVGALGGRLNIESPAGAGTQVTAVIPCAS